MSECQAVVVLVTVVEVVVLVEVVLVLVDSAREKCVM